MLPPRLCSLFSVHAAPSPTISPYPYPPLFRSDQAALAARGLDADAAARRARQRIFGSRPSAYGAGIGALIDGGRWQTRAGERERTRLNSSDLGMLYDYVWWRKKKKERRCECWR